MTATSRRLYSQLLHSYHKIVEIPKHQVSIEKALELEHERAKLADQMGRLVGDKEHNQKEARSLQEPWYEQHTR